MHKKIGRWSPILTGLFFFNKNQNRIFKQTRSLPSLIKLLKKFCYVLPNNRPSLLVKSWSISTTPRSLVWIHTEQSSLDLITASINILFWSSKIPGWTSLTTFQNRFPSSRICFENNSPLAYIDHSHNSSTNLNHLSVGALDYSSFV